ncbi:MAG: hypothetical protein DRI86_10240 [Bacteroidetes bacterium]|nr:MAG: hypothetical protein DRI86_10240 [Bacteroidota bacterium]
MEKNYFLKIVVFISVLFGIHSSSLGQNVSFLEFDCDDSYYVNDASNKLDQNGGNWTYETWLYIDTYSSGDYDVIMDRRTVFSWYLIDGQGNGEYSIRFVGRDGSDNINASIRNDGAGDTEMMFDKWYHVAVSWDGTTARMFVNGKLQDSSTDSDFDLTNSTNAINFACRYWGSYSRYMDGALDEIRFSKSVRYTSNFTKYIYNDKFAHDANTVLLYHLDENSGTSLDNDNDADFDAALRSGSNQATWRVWNYHASSILPLSKNTWDGSSSTDWNTSANWSMDALPTSESYVVVADVTNQPTIASDNTGDCENLEVDASADMTITGTLNVGGDFTNNGVFTTTGTVKYNGSEEQAIAAGTYNDLDIDNSTAANCTFSGDVTVGGTLNIAGDITIQNGNTLDCNGAITTTGDCVINNNGTMNVGSTFTQNGVYVETAGLMKFDGSAAQTIPSDDYYNLEIDNSNGVDLGGNVSVNGILTLTNGLLTSTSTNLFTFTSTAGAVSGGSNSSYIDGPIAKIGSADFIFPAGDGDKWARVGLSGLSASETFTVEYHKSKPSDNTTYSEPLTKVSDNEWWQIDRAGTATADVTYYWEDSKWSGIGDFDDLRLAHWNSTSSEWEEVSGTYSHTGSVDLGNPVSGTLTVTGVSSFSPFAPGTIDNVNNPLPIELLSFDLLNIENKVQLNWSTASELNNSGFEIQRSMNIEEWEVLGFVEGAGISNSTKTYSFIDKTPLVANYYRLKQIDFDGAFVFSPTRYINIDRSNSISLYPNPTTQSISISGVDPDRVSKIYLFNNMGKLIKTYSPNTSKINMESYSLGVYYLRIQYINGKDESFSFIKKK